MTLVTPEATSLDDLASTVRAEYARGQAAHADMVECYFAIGHALLEAREALPSDQAFELYAFVIGDSAWVVPTNLLKQLARDRWRDGRVKECLRGSHPTRGVIVPIAWMVQQMKLKEAA